MTRTGSASPAPADAAFDDRTSRSPRGAMMWIFFRDGAIVSALWFAVFGGANWLTELHGYRVRLWTDLDLSIPFVPAAAAVYLSIFPMFWIAPIALRTTEQLQSLAKALAWSILIAGIGFVLLPGGHARTIDPPTGFSGSIFWVADQVNMSYNYLPSLHVGMSVVCAYAYSQTATRKTAKWFYWIWAGAIAVSTLLTHQHYLADVVTGSALGLWVASKTISQKD